MAAHAAPGWLTALGQHPLPQLEGAAVLASELPDGEHLMLVCGNVAAPAIAADWAGWLHEMQRLEDALFVPLLKLVKDGTVKQLRLVLSHRDGHLDTTTTPMAQRKFWRRPTLEALR
jgi:hypothetical protein